MSPEPSGNSIRTWLDVGTTGTGSRNIYSADQGTGTARTVAGIPTGGQTIYVRLWSEIPSSGWTLIDYQYRAAGP